MEGLQKDSKVCDGKVSSNFSGDSPSLSVALDNPCMQHVGSSEFNESMQAATADGLNSAKPVQGTNFDSSFDDSFVSLSDRAEVADSSVVQVQSSPQNLEESQDLVNHSLSSGQPEMQSEATDGFAFSVEQLTCPVVIEIFLWQRAFDGQSQSGWFQGFFWCGPQT